MHHAQLGGSRKRKLTKKNVNWTKFVCFWVAPLEEARIYKCCGNSKRGEYKIFIIDLVRRDGRPCTFEKRGSTELVFFICYRNLRMLTEIMQMTSAHKFSSFDCPHPRRRLRLLLQLGCPSSSPCSRSRVVYCWRRRRFRPKFLQQQIQQQTPIYLQHIGVNPGGVGGLRAPDFWLGVVRGSRGESKEKGRVRVSENTIAYFAQKPH